MLDGTDTRDCRTTRTLDIDITSINVEEFLNRVYVDADGDYMRITNQTTGRVRLRSLLLCSNEEGCDICSGWTPMSKEPKEAMALFKAEVNTAFRKIIGE